MFYWQRRDHAHCQRPREFPLSPKLGRQANLCTLVLSAWYRLTDLLEFESIVNFRWRRTTILPHAWTRCVCAAAAPREFQK